MASESPNLPVYDATFNLYRVSPLYFTISNPDLSVESLKGHARRCSETVRGRGLGSWRAEEIDDDVDELASVKTGPFKECRWTFVRSTLSDSSEEASDPIARLGAVEGIRIDFEYENTTYMALLLRDLQSKQSLKDAPRPGEPAYVYYPILFTKMPNRHRQVLIEYISLTFDASVQPLYVTGQVIGDVLDAYLKDFTALDPEDWHPIVKDVHLTLSFSPGSPIVNAGLRSLDVTVPREDVRNFVETGKKLPPMRGPSTMTKVATKADTEAKNTDAQRISKGPFMVALRKYLSNHLAMDVYSGNSVALTKVTCGGFSLGKDGRFKLHAPVPPADEEKHGVPNEPSIRLAQASRAAVSRVLNLVLSAATADIQDVKRS